MSRIGIGSVSGSPGVSTLVSAIAFSSTARALLVVECSLDGGVLALRWGLPREATLAELALDAVPGGDLWGEARPWMGSTRLLAADPSPVAMQRSPVARYVADRLSEVTVPTLLDMGRLRADDATSALVSQLDRLWLLLEPTVEHVTAAMTWRPLLEGVEVELLVVDRPAAEGAYPVREIEDELGWRCVDTICRDRRGALLLRGVGSASALRLEHAPLVRQASTLRDRIDTREGVRV